MKSCRCTLLVCSLLLWTAYAQQAPTVELLDLERHFKEVKASGSFTLYDASRSVFQRYNPEAARTGHLPASTFKILNSLIALETGVLKSEKVVLPWDGTEYRTKSWNRDHDMRSAFSNSVVWFYQELAGRIGEKRM